VNVAIKPTKQCNSSEAGATTFNANELDI